MLFNQSYLDKVYLLERKVEMQKELESIHESIEKCERNIKSWEREIPKDHIKVIKRTYKYPMARNEYDDPKFNFPNNGAELLYTETLYFTEREFEAIEKISFIDFSDIGSVYSLS